MLKCVSSRLSICDLARLHFHHSFKYMSGVNCLKESEWHKTGYYPHSAPQPELFQPPQVLKDLKNLKENLDLLEHLTIISFSYDNIVLTKVMLRSGIMTTSLQQSLMEQEIWAVTILFGGKTERIHTWNVGNNPSLQLTLENLPNAKCGNPSTVRPGQQTAKIRQ